MWSEWNMAKRPAPLHVVGASSPAPIPPGRFAYQGLERVLHEKARLGILTSLVTRPEGLLFGELKRMCNLTDGNLSRHLDVLHEAGLVEVWKGFENKRPQTLCRVSRVGRERFVKYLAELEQVIRDAQLSAVREMSRDALPAGWVPV
jgi:DNA-binding MarR family transcriptional regulator